MGAKIGGPQNDAADDKSADPHQRQQMKIEFVDPTDPEGQSEHEVQTQIVPVPLWCPGGRPKRCRETQHPERIVPNDCVL